MVFSENQVRHLYVVKNVKDAVDTSSKAGDIQVRFIRDSRNLYFKYMGKGGLMRSDLVPIDSIEYVNFTSKDAPSQKKALKTATLSLANDYSTPEAGQDYIVDLEVKQFASSGEEDTYIKFGAVHVTSLIDTASKLYVELALSFARNFKRELNQLFTFYVTDGTDLTPVTANSKASDFTGNYTGVVVKEVMQDWVRGLRQHLTVNFRAYGKSVEINGEYVNPWADVVYADSTDTADVIKNGRNIADLEYFLMGERGDIYRNIGWPNVVPTKYMISEDEAESEGYDIIDIHYSYVGDNQSVQKSEKDLTLVCSKNNELTKVLTKLVQGGVPATKVHETVAKVNKTEG